MSDLLSYLKATKTKQSEIAGIVGISRGYLSEIVGGTKRPSLKLAIAIEIATGGAISVMSWNRLAREAFTSTGLKQPCDVAVPPAENPPHSILAHADFPQPAQAGCGTQENEVSDAA